MIQNNYEALGLYNTEALKGNSYTIISNILYEDNENIITVDEPYSCTYLTELLKYAENRPTAPLIIHILEKAEAGAEQENRNQLWKTVKQNLIEQLKEAEIIYYVLDPNSENEETEITRLNYRIKELVTAEEDNYTNEHNSKSIAEEFLKPLSNEQHTIYKTGFEALDRALGYGLYNGLIVLGAVTSLGKTTLLLQIAGNLAKQGNHILYISLEMGKKELVAKSIARESYILSNEEALTIREILNPKALQNLDETGKKKLEEAVKNYAVYGENISFYEGIGNISASQIRGYIEKHKAITGKTPIVIIDYLQILAPYTDIKHPNKTFTDKQSMDNSVRELKQLSRDFNTPVIAISSFNRDTYKDKSSGKATLTAFKESGSIEYSADILIGLQLRGAGEETFSFEEELKRNPRKIEAVILKNRRGIIGEKASLNYYSKHDFFTEKEQITRIKRV